MLGGQGLRANAFHLVGVAVLLRIAPGAEGIRRHAAPRASLRSLAGVDAKGNRRPDMYTPGKAEFNSDYAWMQNFDDGYQDNDDKDNENLVRAVRK